MREKLGKLIFCITIFMLYSCSISFAQNEVLYSGNFDSVDDTIIHQSEIDLSNNKTGSISINKTGLTDFLAEVKNYSGETIWTTYLNSEFPRRYFFMEANEQTTSGVFTITLKPQNYNPVDASYTMTVGDKDIVEKTMSDYNNAVWIYPYNDNIVNLVKLHYVPNNESSWFRFRANKDKTTITILNNYHNKVRFRIRESNFPYDIKYDSNIELNTHKTRFIEGFSFGEKGRFNSKIGQEYLLEIYSSEPIYGVPLIESTLTMGIGDPIMGISSTSSYSSSKVTAKSYDFSPEAIVKFVSADIPNTATALKVRPVVRESGVYGSSFTGWKLQGPFDWSWQTKSNIAYDVEYSYTPYKWNNQLLKNDSIWKVSLKAANSDVSFTPGLYINYTYEMGD